MDTAGAAALSAAGTVIGRGTVPPLLAAAGAAWADMPAVSVITLPSLSVTVVPVTPSTVFTVCAAAPVFCR